MPCAASLLHHQLENLLISDMIHSVYGTVKIFCEAPLDEYIDQRKAAVKSRIHSETAQYLMNVNENEYINHLVDEFQIDPLKFDFENRTASSREEMIPADRFPRDFYVRDAKSYSKPVITYHIPVSGDTELLRRRPSTYVMMTHTVQLKDGCVCFDIIDFRSDSEDIKRQADSVIGTLRAQSQNVQNQVASFNSGLLQFAMSLIEERKQMLTKQNDVMLKLGVPIRKSASVPETFAVPASRKKIAPKPIVPPQASAPVPTLDQNLYDEILRVIHDMGKVFERLPSTYSGKDEETLRDHLIMQLEPHFEGSTTGETFNKNGKTDILIRHQKSNVFVAECKFWGGKAKHLETITQLLSYLTWRDSKTALIYFVNRKEIIPVLDEIKKSTHAHAQFGKLLSQRDNSWSMFEMCLPSDKDCKIQMAVLAFHIPD